MTMTSNCDVTYSLHQIQTSTICHWMKPPHENFLRTPLLRMHCLTKRAYLELRSIFSEPSGSFPVLFSAYRKCRLTPVSSRLTPVSKTESADLLPFQAKYASNMHVRTDRF